MKPPSRASVASARKNIRAECAPGCDPAVVALFALVKPLAGYVPLISRKAGVDRRAIGKWIAGGRTPNVANLRAVLNVLGYDLIVREKDNA